MGLCLDPTHRSVSVTLCLACFRLLGSPAHNEAARSAQTAHSGVRVSAPLSPSTLSWLSVAAIENPLSIKIRRIRSREALRSLPSQSFAVAHQPNSTHSSARLIRSLRRNDHGTLWCRLGNSAEEVNVPLVMRVFAKLTSPQLSKLLAVLDRMSQKEIKAFLAKKKD